MNASLAPDKIQPTSPSGNTLLEVDQISLSFGGVKALQDVSFSVEEKQIMAIIGPNGAGKTSMLNVINGFYHPQQGQIHFKGLHRKQMRPHEAAVQGIARTFQNVALFKGMSTLNNIMAGRNLKKKTFSGRHSITDRPGMRKCGIGLKRKKSSIFSKSSRSGKPRSAVYPTGCKNGLNWGEPWPWSRTCYCWMSRWRE